MTQVSFEQIPAVCEQLLVERRYDDALKVLAAFVDHGAPHYPALNHCLVTAQNWGHTDAVDQLLEQVRARFPEDPRAWWLDARVQQARFAWRDMIAALDRAGAAGADPDRVGLWRARAHLRLADPRTALAILDAIPATTGDPGEYAYLRGETLMLLKRNGDAVEFLRDALARPGENQFVASCWKVLGKALDREGSHDAAFDAFTRGNQLAGQLADLPFEKNPLRQRTAAFRRLVTADWGAAWSGDPAAPDRDQSPVFLVGFPRSGTTLMEQVLDAHPDIVALEEKPLVESVWGQLGHALKRPDPAPEDPVERQAAALASLADLPPSSLVTLRQVYLRTLGQYLPWPDGRVLVDKLPLNLSSLPLIARLFPEGRFIVALRHPCDCILSNYMQDFSMNPGMQFMVDIERAAGLYRDLMALLEQSRVALGLDPRMHFIRYEDLVSDFEPEVRKLLDFLEVDWDPAVTRYDEHARDRGTLATPSYEGVTRQLYTGAIDRWRRYADHLTPVLPLLREPAGRYGYSLEV